MKTKPEKTFLEHDSMFSMPNNQISIWLKEPSNDSVTFFNSLVETVDTLSISDRSLLNSFLALAAYNDNTWIIKNLNKTPEEMKYYQDTALLDESGSTLTGLAIWGTLKKTVRTIPDDAFDFDKIAKLNQDNAFYHNYHSNKYHTDIGFYYREGVYQTIDGMAQAVVVESQEANGEKTIHIAFRGTEAKVSDNALIGVAKHIPAYLDMEAYYEKFKPLQDAVIDYAKKNNISKIEFAGHSLGGACVENALKQLPEDENTPEIQGFTFGSPGANKKIFTKFVNSIYHMNRNVLGFLVQKPFATMEWVAAAIDPRLGISVSGLVTTINPKQIVSEKNDHRLIEYGHTRDPVPILGILGYSKVGERINLHDKIFGKLKCEYRSEEFQSGMGFFKQLWEIPKKIIQKTTNGISEALGINGQSHSMKMYSDNLSAMLSLSSEVFNTMSTKIKQHSIVSELYNAEKINTRKQIVQNQMPTLDSKDTSPEEKTRIKKQLSFLKRQTEEFTDKSTLRYKIRTIFGFEGITIKQKEKNNNASLASLKSLDQIDSVLNIRQKAFTNSEVSLNNGKDVIKTIIKR